MTYNLTQTILIATIVLATLQFGKAHAAGDVSYNRGLAAYKKADYKSAAQYFRKSIAEGNADPNGLLYLGHSYLGYGDRALALRTYCTLADKFPNSPQSKVALQGMQRIAPNTARKYQTNSKQRTGYRDLVDSLIVIEPKFGHPPVSQSTIDIVKNAARRLSPHIYRMLSEGGASMTVAPNSLDKWPQTGNDYIPSEGRSLGEVPGRTWHREGMGPDIYIFERAIVKGSNSLQEPYSKEKILQIALHEMGHGVDDLQTLSMDSGFLAVHKQDVDSLTPEAKEEYRYYTTPMEACAEITGGFAGHNESAPHTASVIRNFPKTAQWLKNRLHL